jgi:sigma-B regulation protein RsbU (phosphoserine phosphatase)
VPRSRREIADLVVAHTADILAGNCSITEEAIVKHADDPTVGELLTGLYYLHQELCFRKDGWDRSLRELTEQNLEREKQNARLERALGDLGVANQELRDIPRRIQASILPGEVTTNHMSIAAKMIAAEDIGGDYYDILPASDGLWIAIGDVAGHGLESGVIMLMVQAAVAALTRSDARPPDPRMIVCALNEVMYENIRRRMRGDHHVTLSLARYHDDGRFAFAGAHEDILVYRSGTGRCERLETPGTWVGAIRDVRPHTTASLTSLAHGDIVALYTDGITEAMAPGGEQFGLDRLSNVIERTGSMPVEDIRDEVYREVGRWSEVVEDDRTLIIARHLDAKADAASTQKNALPG